MLLFQSNATTLFSGDVLKLLARGNRNRAVACTRMNRESSRGHALFLVQLRRMDRTLYNSQTATMFLVDLAGSEKVAKTGFFFLKKKN